MEKDTETRGASTPLGAVCVHRGDLYEDTSTTSRPAPYRRSWLALLASSVAYLVGLWNAGIS